MRAAACLVALALAAPLAAQSFDADPGWEGFRNRLVPDPVPLVRQDFGHRPTRHAGGTAAGELGGRLQRSLTLARYVKPIPPRTLNDTLTAAGTFAVTVAEGSSGVLLGWCHESSRGWRTPNSLAVRLDGNGGKYWVLFEYGTRTGLTGGGAVFEGRYQTTTTKPLPADGTPHRWSLTYDPAGTDGRGEMVFVLDGTTYRHALAPGHRTDGATFNRFGLWNQQLAGQGMEVFVDDLELDGQKEGFDRDPGWESLGNPAEFRDRARRPYHDFGFSPTAHTGGRPGEVGGLIWRDEAPAYYADRVGPLSLDGPLEASGRLVLRAAAADSAAYFGWFNAALKQSDTPGPDRQERPRALLGVLVEGPSRVGHYIRPAYRTAAGDGVTRKDGPVLRPDGTPHRWWVRYDPAAASGRGRITFRFDDAECAIDLEPGHRNRMTTFDRFGLFNAQTGGHYVELYLDELRYSGRP